MQKKRPFQFCAYCGSSVIEKIPFGDNRKRFVCTKCDSIFYENPKVVTGCLLSWENKILMCKRATRPQKGLWTLPAGFLENNETTEEGARRETYEEAYAKASTLQLFMICSLPHISQVYMIYKGNLCDGAYKAGPESEEVQLFLPKNIPWNQIAFSVITKTLEQYLIDQKDQRVTTHCYTLDRRNEMKKMY